MKWKSIRTSSALFQALWVIALIGLAPSVSLAASGGFSGDEAVIDPESEDVAVVCNTCQSVSDFRDAVATRWHGNPVPSVSSDVWNLA